MVKIVYGSVGSGKTTYIHALAKKAAESGKKTVVIVPEQQVLETESALCGESVYIDVVSFRRVCNDIFRVFGGVCYDYIGKGGKTVLMWRAISSLASLLSEYKNITISDMSVSEMMVSAVDEFGMYNISPENLMEASEKTSDKKLSGKLRDIALIYSNYHSMLHEIYDDPADDLTRAAEALENNDFFTDKCVFIDSFDGFTPQEGLLLEQIIRQSDEVTVSLSYLPDDKREMNTKIRNTERMLKKLSEYANKKIEKAYLTDTSFRNPEIEFLCKNIFTYNGTVYDKVPESIHIVEYSGIYEEAQAVASDICRLVQCGARYKEIAIIARDTGEYEGIIDAALDGCAVPYYISSRSGVMSMPEVRMIISALAVYARGWRQEDVISYMRCGLSSLDVSQCDEIESYVHTWRINGKRWYDDTEWRMNPDGYTAENSENTEKSLNELNSLRRILTEPLVKLFEVFKETPTVREVSIALYNFLSDMSVREGLMQRAKAPKENGNDELAQQADGWNCLMRSLDELVKSAGDTPIGCDEYAQLLKAVLSKADIGKIPSRNDEVTVASASLSRKNGIKYVYVIGLSEGVFPRNTKLSGLLSESEKDYLSSVGIETSPCGDESYYDELLYFCKTLKAQNYITFSYYTSSQEGANKVPSSLIEAVRTVFPNVKTVKYSNVKDEDKAYGLYPILEYAARSGNDELLSAVSKHYGIDVQMIKTPFDASGDIMTMKTEKGDIRLSSTKLEQFVKCPFAYRCKYTLGLSDIKNGTFERVDIGNFMHKILEMYFSRYKDTFRQMTKSEIAELSSEIVDQYTNGLWKSDVDARIKGLVKRLKKLSALLLENITEEFANSDFSPVCFELPIGASDSEGRGADSMRINLDSGAKVVISGKVDRVDIYKSGGKSYIRIVDYKTGAKEFKLEDVEDGLNMQMLIYLFALCSPANKRFSKIVGSEERVPAGILYMPSKMPSLKADSIKDTDNEESTAKKINSELKRNGYLLNDNEILCAMEHSLSGVYIPAKANSKNEGEVQGSLYTLTALADLETKIEKTIRSLAQRIEEGDARAVPYNKGDKLPCEYCSMKPVCRVCGDVKGGV